MIVDFHTHIFPEKIAAKTIQKLERIGHARAFTDGREISLVESMEHAGIDVSVVLPVVTSPEQFYTVNQFAQHLNEKYEGMPHRLISFGGIHPDTPDYKKELRAIKYLGLPGIKLHPDYQNTYFDDIRYMRILDYASELGLTCVTHAGIDIGFPDNTRCTVERILKVLNEVAPKNLVLAHYGGYRFWEEVESLIAGRDVYLDTAFIFDLISEKVFLNILKKHGADKILFATDSPWSGQEESLARLKAIVAKDYSIKWGDIENILGQNAIKLLRLEEEERDD